MDEQAIFDLINRRFNELEALIRSSIGSQGGSPPPVESVPSWDGRGWVNGMSHPNKHGFVQLEQVERARSRYEAILQGKNWTVPTFWPIQEAFTTFPEEFDERLREQVVQNSGPAYGGRTMLGVHMAVEVVKERGRWTRGEKQIPEVGIVAATTVADAVREIEERVAERAKDSYGGEWRNPRY